MDHCPNRYSQLLDGMFGKLFVVIVNQNHVKDIRKYREYNSYVVVWKSNQAFKRRTKKPKEEQTEETNLNCHCSKKLKDK